MLSVLIVDDAAFMRITIRTMLEKNGFHIAGEAEDGVEGVKMYQELKPDLVTMDITMPNMDGIQAVQAIMKIDPNAKILMMSAMGQESFVREAIMNGAKSFIVKPFKEEKVVQILNKIATT